MRLLERKGQEEHARKLKIEICKSRGRNDPNIEHLISALSQSENFDKG